MQQLTRRKKLLEAKCPDWRNGIIVQALSFFFPQRHNGSCNKVMVDKRQFDQAARATSLCLHSIAGMRQWLALQHGGACKRNGPTASAVTMIPGLKSWFTKDQTSSEQHTNDPHAEYLVA